MDLRSNNPADQFETGLGTKTKSGRPRRLADMIAANHQCGLLFQSQHPCLLADSLPRLARYLNSGDLSRCDKLTSKQSQKSQLTFSVTHSFAVNPTVRKGFSIPSWAERLKSTEKPEIAILQTKYFPKPFQNLEFSQSENAD